MVRARVRAVNEQNRPAVVAFLERHVDTALLLLSNLMTHGPTLRDDLSSGNFKCIVEEDDVRAVFCLTRRGNLLAEAGGRTESAAIILTACDEEPIRVCGLVGEWPLAEAMWRLLQTRPGFVATSESREILQSLELPAAVPMPASPHVRRLRADDFAQWEPLYVASLVEDGLSVRGSTSDRRRQFERNAGDERWWGYFDQERLLATAALATYARVGQVGGVYTVPGRRGMGLGRATMCALLSDAVQIHRLTRLTLFVSEERVAARRLYESLGFHTIGSFALCYCSWADQPGAS